MSYRDTGKDYFQTSDSLATVERKQAKSKNTHGKPIKFSSKLLALHPDPDDARAIYVAEAAGNIKRVVLEVCHKLLLKYQRLTMHRLERRYKSYMLLLLSQASLYQTTSSLLAAGTSTSMSLTSQLVWIHVSVATRTLSSAS